MKRTIKIELLSDACPGSGVGHAGVIDRDFVVDDLGLPFIPGRRLKGLLRDAYEDIAPYRDGVLSAAEVFGDAGAKTPAKVSINDARLSGYSRLREWLSSVKAGKRPTVFRADVVRAYSAVRRQNAINRSTGSSLDDHLRVTRVIGAGTAFEASVSFPESGSASSAVRDSVKALKQFGSSRTRGLGEVRCSLDDVSRSKSSIRGTAFINHGRMHYRISLQSPAIFPQASGDPNSVTSREFIPGSAILGVFANLWPDKDGEFFDIFFRGEVRFLSAYPVASEQRAIPIPAAIRQVKSSEDDFVDVTEGWASDVALRRTRGWCSGGILGPSRSAARVSVAKRFSYHHQRSDDRRIGRAISSEKSRRPVSHGNASSGSFFGYEAIEEGQVFEGVILGDEAILRRLATHLDKIAPGGPRLGRSRSAEYGGDAIWTWLDEAEREGEREVQSWQRSDEDVADLHGEVFRVTLLSPVAWFNDEGHPAPTFPWEELIRTLKIKSLTVEQEYSRTRLQSGYLSHQGLPRQQMPSLEMGSVFVVRANEPVSSTRLLAAEAQSFGVRTEEGFGRVCLELIGRDDDSRTPALRKPAPAVAGSVELQDSSDPAYSLAVKVFMRAVLEEAKTLAANHASEDAGEIHSIPYNQLARLLQIFEQNEITQISEKLNNLKEKSRKGLGIIHPKILKTMTEPANSTPGDSLYRRIYQGVLAAPHWEWHRVFRKTGSPESTAIDRNRAIRLYLLSYVRALMEYNRVRR
jgi:CRISPR-associated protein Csx10